MNWLENLPLQVRYSQWVNWRLYDACATLPDDERKHDRGVFFHSIHGTWNHLLLGDCVWLARLQGRPVRTNAWTWSFTAISILSALRLLVNLTFL